MAGQRTREGRDADHHAVALGGDVVRRTVIASTGTAAAAVTSESEHGYEVRVKGRVGPAALRNFEPWDVQGIDGRTSIFMPYASRPALAGLLSRLDDFALELVEVVPLPEELARRFSAGA